jgi:hypothetical protein
MLNQNKFALPGSSWAPWCSAVIVVVAAAAQNSPTPYTLTGQFPTSLAGLAPIETEVVEIGNFSAFPATITRKPGRFALHIMNRATRNPTALVLSSTNVAAPVLDILSNALNLSGFAKTRQLIIPVNLSSGVYVFKSQATGKTLLTVTIE